MVRDDGEDRDGAHALQVRTPVVSGDGTTGRCPTAYGSGRPHRCTHAITLSRRRVGVEPLPGATTACALSSVAGAAERPATMATGRMSKVPTVDSKNGWVRLTAIEAATAARYGPPRVSARYITTARTTRYGTAIRPPIWSMENTRLCANVWLSPTLSSDAWRNDAQPVPVSGLLRNSSHAS